ncbi:MAG: helix-turn-helix domain-containing protein [Oscillospiraceae bacterium]|nr:helix-turn-helix domain-containing protein [Oscillospiraceae bacterium]
MDTVFSSQLQRLRKKHNVTQETLAAHLGVSPQAVSKWENGSYPDGDLLPKIADFFGVSIDYLYGRAKEDASVVQQIIDELQKSFQSSENSEKLFFEQAMKYVWAIQTASWAANKYYYDRPELNVTDSITVSELSSKEGFSYMRLNKDLEYYFLVKQPKEGFAKRLRITDKMAELFAFLGDKTNLKILQYMLSLNWKEAVRAKTIAKLINIPVEKAEKALDFLCKFNGMFTKGSIINEDNKSENIYQSSPVKAVAPIMLMICADMMTTSPSSYQNQVGWNDEAWLRREDLSFLKNNER